MLIASDRFTWIIGLGKTGLSCARHLTRQGTPFGVMDTRDNPPNRSLFEADYPQVPLLCGELDAEKLSHASRILVSPGVAITHPAIQQAVGAGVELLGDIDLFCEAVEVPIVAITGSNAKSTVTTLVGEMAEEAGVKVGVGGNLGKPVLEMLEEDAKALYVLELSSFQLETTTRLAAAAATVLNVSPDHMDRYPDLASYHAAKQRIYRNCKHAVCNHDDMLTRPLLPPATPLTEFGLSQPDLKQFGVLFDQGQAWLAQGPARLMPVAEMAMRGEHNVANALAALALGNAVGLPLEAMIRVLKRFTGLRHRCQWVRTFNGVDYVNDSKGTNVGATLAAIQGLGRGLSGKLLIILGGDGKGADFSELAIPAAEFARAVLLIGRDAERIAEILPEGLPQVLCGSLADAVAQAARLAVAGDLVLLSPACASFDMFSGFEQRGDQFIELVEAL